MTAFASERRSLKAKVSGIGISLLGCLLLLWPPLLSGQPFLMQDTTAYIRGADAAVYQLTGRDSEWTSTFFDRFGSDAKMWPDRTEAVSQASPTRRTIGANAASNRPVVLTGRSLYYGGILRLSWALGSLWWTAVLQALLVSVSAILTFRHIQVLLGREAAAVSAPVLIGLLALVTPVAYFSGYLVPDIFTPLAILGAAHLFLLRKMLSKGEAFFWFVLICAAELFHNSNTAIIVAMTVVCIGWRLVFGRTFDWFAALIGGSAIVIALLGNAAFSYAVERTTGEPPIGPPFVAARLIADGPGYEYLRSTCPGNGFYLCNFLDASRDSNTFLWAEHRPEGAFKALDPWQQRLVAKEQRRFVLAVIADRPISVVASSLRNFAKEITNFKNPYFNYRAGLRNYFDRKLPSSLSEDTHNTYAFKNRMPERSIELMTEASTALSLLVLIYVIASKAGAAAADTRLRAFIALVFLGVLANDFVCAALSSPAARYHMRAIWLLPLLALSLMNVWGRLARAKLRSEKESFGSPQPQS